MTLSDFANHLVALLVIANPLSALTAMIRVTYNQSVAQKRHTALMVLIASSSIMLIAAWVGKPLLAILGIKLPAFQVAGSIIILFLAFSMLYAEESPMKQSPEEQKEKIRGDSGAIVPLAIPIIAGPGTITTIIVSVNDFPGLLSQLFISLSGILVALLIYIVLFFSHDVERLIGQRGVNIFNRIGGLLLAAIAIQSMANGILGLFPILNISEAN